MIQDIAPRIFDNVYTEKTIHEEAVCFAFSQNQVLKKAGTEEHIFPKYKEIKAYVTEYVYLFKISEEDFFLVRLSGEGIDGFEYEDYKAHRHVKPKYRVFAEMTAYHLNTWYKNNTFCGRCGHRTTLDPVLRAIKCPECGNLIFPRISPAIIVGVTDKNRLLMTKYNGRDYKGYALVAGFIEIGETAEDTIRREVFEEVGIKIKNIRYYGSQPWGMDCNFLLGYFAELDGDGDITMDEDELSLASWYTPEEITVTDDDISLTSQMIDHWKKDVLQTKTLMQ